MYLVLELEPEGVLQIDASQWTSATMPADDELPTCILSMDFMSEESLNCSGVLDPVCSLKFLLGCLF